MAQEGYDFTMIEEDTYSIVTEKIPVGKTLLLPVLAFAPRHSLSRRQGDGLQRRSRSAIIAMTSSRRFS